MRIGKEEYDFIDKECRAFNERMKCYDVGVDDVLYTLFHSTETVVHLLIDWGEDEADASAFIISTAQRVKQMIS